MEFALSSEQEMLRETARRFLAASPTPWQQTDASSSDEGWNEFAAMGWLALSVPEDAGGLGGSMEDVSILAEELGRALSPLPFVNSAVLAAGLADVVGNGDQRKRLLGVVASGEQRIAPALHEPGRRYSTLPETRAAACTEGYLLSGSKCLVEGATSADLFLVSATLESGAIGLFVVDRDHPAVIARDYLAIDNRSASDLQFEQASVSVDALLGTVSPQSLEQTFDRARLAICADTLGALERSIELTTTYLKTRTQFGQPLANFQALQHSVVEMYVETDLIRSSLYQALAAYNWKIGHEVSRAVSSCWVKTFASAKEIAGMAIHLHGAIGMTCEYPVGHYLRRIMVSERSFGDVEYHLARFMAQTA